MLLKPKINFEPCLAQTHQNLAKPFSVPLHPWQDQYYLLVLVFHGTQAKKKKDRKGAKKMKQNSNCTKDFDLKEKERILIERLQGPLSTKL